MFTQETLILLQRHTYLLRRNESKRKEHGIVYTPPALVSTLVSLAFTEIPLPPEGLLRILDPSCGTGNFLVEAYRRLLEVTPRVMTAAQRVEVLQNSIFGCDLDKQAMEIAKRRLWQTALEGTGEWIPFAQFPHDNFVVGDALSLIPTHDPARLFPETGWGLWLASVFQKPFDVIIGNPPYGKVRLANAQRQYFASSLYGHANTYSLFVHAGVELLQAGGVLGYVIPASMLSGLYFQNLRKFLSDRCHLRAIVQFDNRESIFESVLQEVMLLVIQRGQLSNGRSVRVATVKHEKQLADFSVFNQQLREVPENVVLRQSNGYWLMHVPTFEGTDAIYDKYEAHGVPLTDPSIGYTAKTGPIVWNRLKALLRDAPGDDTLPLAWSNNVGYYQFAARGNREMKSGYLLCNERTRPLVTSELCLLAQRTTAKEQRRRIIAAFPKVWQQRIGSFFVENHVNIIIPIKGVTTAPFEYVLALLNSRLFDFIFRTFNGNTQVSATELNVMRFAVPHTDDVEEIVELVNQLQQAKAASQQRKAAELAATLDQIVYHLYRLTPLEIETVESHTRRAIA
jgi:hypothetical protein